MVYKSKTEIMEELDKQEDEITELWRIADTIKDN